jgi:DNA repair and recombination RAD54-like protein
VTIRLQQLTNKSNINFFNNVKCITIAKVKISKQVVKDLSLECRTTFESNFNWIQGEDVLYMHGNLKVYEHQKLIKHFNNANSEIKVLLASTRACFEGINLFDALRML